MRFGRREFLFGAAAAVLGSPSAAAPEEKQQMYGLIGSMTAAPGRREENNSKVPMPFGRGLPPAAVIQQCTSTGTEKARLFR